MPQVAVSRPNASSRTPGVTLGSEPSSEWGPFRVSRPSCSARATQHAGNPLSWLTGRGRHAPARCTPGVEPPYGSTPLVGESQPITPFKIKPLRGGHRGVVDRRTRTPPQHTAAFNRRRFSGTARRSERSRPILRRSRMRASSYAGGDVACRSGAEPYAIRTRISGQSPAHQVGGNPGAGAV